MYVERKVTTPKNAINPSQRNICPRLLVVVATTQDISLQIVPKNPNSPVAIVMQKVMAPKIVLYLPPSFPHCLPPPSVALFSANLFCVLGDGVDK